MKRIRRLLRPKPSSALAPLLATGILIATAAVSLAGWKASLRQDEPPSRVSVTDRALPPVYTQWIGGPISYIITPQERAAFLRLTTNAERQEFIQGFWARRNPNPGSPDNTFKDEFDRRVSYADEHFAYSDVPGWNTDRGHYYIAYGPPDDINKYSKGSHGPYAVEIWHYDYIPGIGRSVQFTFVDRAGNGDFQLTFKPRELPAVRWPELASSVPEARHGSVVVTIDKTQTLYVGNKPVSIHDLSSIVRRKLDSNPTASVYLRADMAVPWGVITTVMDALHESHISNVHIIAQPLKVR